FSRDWSSDVCSSDLGGSKTPTGTITFLIDGGSPTSVPLDGSGQASFTTSSLSMGTYTIEASYSGDAIFAASNATPLTQVVNAVPAPVVAVFQDGFTPIPNGTGVATFVGTAGTPILSS